MLWIGEACNQCQFGLTSAFSVDRAVQTLRGGILHQATGADPQIRRATGSCHLQASYYRAHQPAGAAFIRRKNIQRDLWSQRLKRPATLYQLPFIYQLQRNAKVTPVHLYNFILNKNVLNDSSEILIETFTLSDVHGRARQVERQRERWEKRHHRRRRRSISREKWVETLVVADPKMMEYYGKNGVESYVLAVMNIVSISLLLSLQVISVGFLTWTPVFKHFLDL